MILEHFFLSYDLVKNSYSSRFQAELELMLLQPLDTSTGKFSCRCLSAIQAATKRGCCRNVFPPLGFIPSWLPICKDQRKRRQRQQSKSYLPASFSVLCCTREACRLAGWHKTGRLWRRKGTGLYAAYVTQGDKLLLLFTNHSGRITAGVIMEEHVKYNISHCFSSLEKQGHLSGLRSTWIWLILCSTIWRSRTEVIQKSWRVCILYMPPPYCWSWCYRLKTDNWFVSRLSLSWAFS